MANTIALAQKYVPVLDAVYKAESKTAILDATAVDFTGVDTIKVYKSSTSGLGNYDKTSGYPAGDVTGTWETLQLTKDRAKEINIDRYDNEETLNMAFAAEAGKYVRENVAPELDAYRFATYATKAGLTGTATDVGSITDAIGMIDTAVAAMNDAEVPETGRILFVSNAFYKLIKKGVERLILNGEGDVKREVEVFDGMTVVKVPQGRFNTAITLSATAGFTPTAGGKKINFMIVHPSACVQVVKGALPKIFTPDENQTKDAWKFQYRVRHDAFVYDNKVDGIYLDTFSTANT